MTIALNIEKEFFNVFKAYHIDDMVTIHYGSTTFSIEKCALLMMSKTFYSQYMNDQSINSFELTPAFKSVDFNKVLEDLFKHFKIQGEFSFEEVSDIASLLLFLNSTLLIDSLKKQLFNHEFFFDYASSEPDIAYKLFGGQYIDYLSSKLGKMENEKIVSILTTLGPERADDIFKSTEFAPRNEDQVFNVLYQLIAKSKDFFKFLSYAKPEFVTKNCFDSFITDLENVPDIQMYMTALKPFIFQKPEISTPWPRKGFVENIYKDCGIELSRGIINKENCRHDTYEVEISLPNKCVLPIRYKIKLRNDDRTPDSYFVSWKIEGKTMNDEYKLLHETNNTPFSTDMHIHNLSPTELFKSFKLSRSNYGGNYNLYIYIFDIDGIVYDY